MKGEEKNFILRGLTHCISTYCIMFSRSCGAAKSFGDFFIEIAIL